MDSASASAETLKQQITATEDELDRLKAQLASIEAHDAGLDVGAGDLVTSTDDRKWPLSEEEYRRYGRQMIVPNIGIQGQLRLKTSSVLIVGAGGLGCPAAAYLAGAGVGTIGIVDGDEVETSNLHRQILHNTATVGTKKVDSIISYLKLLNPNPTYNAHTTHLTPQNSASIVSQYDLILDCTDHPTSRYLISDISVLLCKPLVSASALRTDGQLIVLNSPPLPPGNPAGGPCYRCVFPKPPPAESVVSCGDGGIVGPVVGVMGVLQALEAIKLIVAGKLKADTAPDADADAKVPSEAKTEAREDPVAAKMLLFSANSSPQFRSVRLRARRPKCFACSSSSSSSSEEARLSLSSLTSGSLDYVLFCGVNSPINLLRPEERISASQYHSIITGEQNQNQSEPPQTHLLIDVREAVQFEICSLPGSINIPFSSFSLSLRSSTKPPPPSSSASSSSSSSPSPSPSQSPPPQPPSPPWLPPSLPPSAPIYIICRLGNDSQIVARKLQDSALLAAGPEGRFIGDIRGGLRAWREQVDGSWPAY